MITIEKLNTFGANTAEGLARCFGNEALYLKLVATIPGEGNFDKLKDSIAAKDLKAAFEAAHALKGSIGNLALTPIFNPVCELVELLRGKKEMVDTGTLVETILSEREKLCKLDA